MNTIRKTHPGPWDNQPTRFADLGAGVSHRQAEGPYVCSPREEAQDTGDGWTDFVILGTVALIVFIAALVGFYGSGIAAFLRSMF